MNEFKMMKEEPSALLDYYMQLLREGQELTEDQVIKLEYLKKLMIRE